jgi:cation-transporting ATPase 13A3/4/5
MSNIAVPYLTAVLAYFIGLGFLWSQDWYIPLNPLDIHIPPKDWMKKGDNYESAVAFFFLLGPLINATYVFSYGWVFRQSVIKNIGLTIMYVILMIALYTLCLTGPTEFGCVYRINCDTEQSLASKNIPLLPLYSVGGVGGCFLGPQVATWQDAMAQPPNSQTNPYWTPDNADDPPCQPAPNVLARIPYNDTKISMNGGKGPNNVWSKEFSWTIAIILTVYILFNHFFKRFVLQGTVARAMRKEQKREDDEAGGAYESGEESDYEESEDGEE